MVEYMERKFGTLTSENNQEPSASNPEKHRLCYIFVKIYIHTSGRKNFNRV